MNEGRREMRDRKGGKKCKLDLISVSLYSLTWKEKVKGKGSEYIRRRK